MPKITLSQPFEHFHGSVGAPKQQVLWSVGQRNYSRQFVVPDNPETARQVLLRGYLTAAAQAYQALDAATALAWRTAAASKDTTDIFGISGSMSGIQYFTQVNTYRQIDGQAIDDTVPTAAMPSSPTAIAVSRAAATQISFGITHANSASTGFWAVRLAYIGSSEARLARRNELRNWSDTLADNIAAIASSVQTMTLTQAAATVVAGEFIGYQLIPLSNDYEAGTPVFLSQAELS